MAEVKEITVPDIGDFDAVDVIEVLVAPGDSIEQEQSLITLESDKATMEVPAPFAGTLKEVRVKVGDKVSKGDVIATAELAGEEPAESSPQQPKTEPVQETIPREEPAEEEPRPGTEPPAKPEDIPETEVIRDPVAFAHKVESDHKPFEPAAIDPEAHRKAHASPAVRAFARELGVDLSQVKGSGRKGRILQEDVKSHIKQRMQGGAAAAGPAGGGAGIPAVPVPDFSKWGETETVPLSRIKKLSGPNLHRSWLNVPHVTQFDQADITELDAFRKAQKTEAEKQGVKLTPLAFFVKATAAALRAFPQVNSSLAPEGDALILKRYVHIGVAVDTPDGLLVPVIRDADRKGVYDIARELGELSEKARNKKLSPGEMQGASFSISSLGGIGGTYFTPIVNAPEVAILGISKAEMKPVWNGSEFVPRLMLPLSLSYDHRVIDGADAARFTTHLSQLLGDLRRLLL